MTQGNFVLKGLLYLRSSLTGTHPITKSFRIYSLCLLALVGSINSTILHAETIDASMQFRMLDANGYPHPWFDSPNAACADYNVWYNWRYLQNNTLAVTGTKPSFFCAGSAIDFYYYCQNGGTLTGINLNMCGYTPSCTSPNVRQPDGTCQVPVVKPTCTSNQIRDKNNTCIPKVDGKTHTTPDCKSSTRSDNGSSSISSSPYVRNPINAGSGDKTQQEIIYSNNGIVPLIYQLSYVSSQASAQYKPNLNHGYQWVSNYVMQLNVDQTTAPNIAPSNVYATRPNGQLVNFSLSGSVYVSDSNINDKLTRLFSPSNTTYGWRIAAADNSIENYNLNGQLISIVSPIGLTQTYTYNTQGRLSVIADGLGRSMSLTYDTQNRVATLTQPDSGIVQFAYDTNNNLSTVTWPDSTVRQYVYENPALPNNLTGIIDENNNRYATWAYDTNGRAISSEHAGSVEKSTIAYTVNGSGQVTSSVVTDIGTGASRTYNFTTILDMPQSTGESQPSGSGCAASSAALTYDANGNVASRTDFNGNMTTYSYDLSRNLETSRTEGLTSTGATTTVTRTITTTWHAKLRVPLVITEYAGATATGTALRITTYTYDNYSSLKSLAVNDPALALTRTTTITNTPYTAVPGMLSSKQVDGPRTDVSDIYTYTYYLPTDTCVGCRAKIKTISDPAGLVTQFTSYDLNGNLLSMTDPNGLVTTNVYDARQRLTSSTVGTLTTSLVYDAVGQVTKLTLPDGSNLNYTYDAAHRLTQVQDGLGNKVVYTLDSEGNRVAENTYDPLGALAKTLSRSYDQLNRLQTLTGITQ